ncbi:hypothetical protein D8T51_00620 [Vibrio vulnificus]|nr:hypothetical protein D8T51_00620 [Vibrio vulnificus]
MMVKLLNQRSPIYSDYFEDFAIIFQTALASKTVNCIIRRTDLFSCEPMSSEEPAASVVG